MYVFNHNNELISVDYLLFITPKDTTFFSGVNTQILYGDDILVPMSDIMKLKNNILTQIIIVPKDTTLKDIYLAPKNPDYFKRFLPLITYIATKQ